MIVRAILKIAVNAGAMYLAAAFLNDVVLDTGGSRLEFIGILTLVGAVVWIGNSIIKPILKVLTFPLILVTFGLFNIILNMLILWGADILLPQLEITGFLTLFLASLIVSVVNSLLFFI